MKIPATPKTALTARIQRLLEPRKGGTGPGAGQGPINPRCINYFEPEEDEAPSQPSAPSKIVNRKSSIVKVVALWLLAFSLQPSAFSYQLTYPLSPDDAGGAVTQYLGVWAITNNYPTNTVWNNFGQAPAGTTNIFINSAVPSPAYLAVRALGTNFLLSSPTNIVLYNTNALALIYTNVPVAPRSPGTPALSQ